MSVCLLLANEDEGKETTERSGGQTRRVIIAIANPDELGWHVPVSGMGKKCPPL
jgi:hypothetical protein